MLILYPMYVSYKVLLHKSNSCVKYQFPRLMYNNIIDEAHSPSRVN